MLGFEPTRRRDRRDSGSHATRTQEDNVTSLDVAIDQQALAIGGRIRALRRARGLTLVQLAAIAQLSHPFLSQLELMAAVEDAAEPVESPTVLVRANEGTRGPYGGGSGRLLVHGRRRFHPMEFTGDNLDAGEYFVHDEDEFVHVVAGVVVVDLAHHGMSTLREGDSLYYVGGTPHRWSAIDAEGYRLFVVKEKPVRL